VRAKHAQQIRRGILRANADIRHRVIFLPLKTELEVRAYHERTTRHFGRWQERLKAQMTAEGMEL